MTVALVTGANGFIGSHLTRELLRRGIETRGLVRSTSHLASLDGVPVSLHVGDLREPASLIPAVREVDYVFHLAAELLVTNRDAFREANSVGTRNLLEAVARRTDERLKRFLFVSSQAAAGPAPSETPIDETHQPDPISWYGESKRDAEQVVGEFGSRIPCTTVRPAAVYGPRERDLSRTYAAIEARIHPRLGLRKKYLVAVYVEDLVKGMVDAATSPDTVGRTYFLNHAEVLSGGGFVKGVARGMDKPAGLPLPVPILLIRLAAPLAEAAYHFTRSRPAMTRDKAREVAQRYWVASPARARDDFGWEAAHDITSGMRETVASWREAVRRQKLKVDEDPLGLWVKTLLVAMLIGAAIEITSYTGSFYTFTPAWGAIAVVVVAFGLALGSTAHLLRGTSVIVQFLAGTVLATGAELLNELGALPGISWAFAPGWPLGITNGWLRSLVLGTAGGFFVLIVSAVMTALYRRRERMG